MLNARCLLGSRINFFKLPFFCYFTRLMLQHPGEYWYPDEICGSARAAADSPRIYEVFWSTRGELGWAFHHPRCNHSHHPLSTTWKKASSQLCGRDESAMLEFFLPVTSPRPCCCLFSAVTASHPAVCCCWHVLWPGLQACGSDSVLTSDLAQKTVLQRMLFELQSNMPLLENPAGNLPIHPSFDTTGCHPYSITVFPISCHSYSTKCFHSSMDGRLGLPVCIYIHT